MAFDKSLIGYFRISIIRRLINEAYHRHKIYTYKNAFNIQLLYVLANYKGIVRE